MKKKILSVGQCLPDTFALRALIEENFDAELVTADRADDTLSQLRAGGITLVLVNRKLDIDYSDGLEIIKQIKADPQLASVPAMLVTNYSEHQDAAVAAGAERGFGKLELDQPETLFNLRRFLA